MKIIYTLLTLFMILSHQLNANHLIGGELSYSCLGGSTYLIKLDIYRDCNCTNCAEFDNPAKLTIFDGNNTFVNTLDMKLFPSKQVEPNIDGLCLETIPDVCVESANYVEQIKLNSNSNGYKLVYQRCCRNNTITNITDPGDTGSTYEVHIPPSSSATCNNSPVFKNFPPIVICSGFPLEFDNAATDLDGDSLVYELCTPFRGANPQDPQPTIASSPSYQAIRWEDDYDEKDQIGGDMPLTIDSETGLLTGFPTTIGQFVVGICVKEIRNDKLLSTSTRDFQFNISDCGIVKAKVKSDDITPNGIFVIRECEGFEVQFINESIGAESYFWDFGDPSSDDNTSILANPVHAYPDTGKYTIKLIADPDFECNDVAIIELSLYPTLAPDFSYVANCATTPVSFTDISTSDYGDIIGWTWNFGDGQISTENNPSHTYVGGGEYDVTLSVETSLNCLANFTKSFDLRSTPISEYGNTALCLDAQPVSFNDESEIDVGEVEKWSWILYDSDSIAVANYNTKLVKHTFGQPGIYNIQLEVTANNGCKAIKTESVTIYDQIEVNAGMDENICLEDSIQLNAIANVPATFNWSVSDTSEIDFLDIPTPTVFPKSTTTFTLYAIDPNGCEAQDKVTVNLRPNPFINLGDDIDACKNDRIQINAIARDGYGNTDNLNYTWDSNDFLNLLHIPNPIATPLENTTLILTVIETSFGCLNKDTLQINVQDPIAAFISSDTLVCKNSPFQLTAAGGDFYNWSPNLGFDIDSPNPTIRLSENTTFTVEISNNCYKSVAQVDVGIKEIPTVDAGWDFDIDVGDIIELNGTIDSVDIASYFWLPEKNLLENSGNLTPVAQPVQNATYYLTAISNNGCSAVDSVNITVDETYNLWIPTAFTPNNDGVNDGIGIFTLGVKKLEIFRIFNRWGTVIYESNSVESTWDGTYNGKPQDTGVYIFYAVGITYLDEPFYKKGNITLIR